MIQIVELHFESHLCPTTLVGKTTDGETICARYRWGHLTVRIDPREDPPCGGAEGTWIFAEQIGDEYDGCLDYEELKTRTKGLVEWPEREPE